MAPSSELTSNTDSSTPLTLRTTSTASTYDFVKVRVWLDDDALNKDGQPLCQNAHSQPHHSYILSRYMLSRLLVSCTTDWSRREAVQTALKLKKTLVDNGQLHITQRTLECMLKEMLTKQAGEQFAKRYRVLHAFQMQRIPLIILITGAPASGKKETAANLSIRLNITNCIHTETFWMMMQVAEKIATNESDTLLNEPPWWMQSHKSNENRTALYKGRCNSMFEALGGELDKCMRGGKALLLSGPYLDSRLFERFRQHGAVVAAFAMKPSATLRQLLIDQAIERHMQTHRSGTDICCSCCVDEALANANWADKWLYEAAQESPVTVNEVLFSSITKAVKNIHSTVLDIIAQQLTVR